MMMMMSLPSSSGSIAHEPVSLNITHYKGDSFELMFTYRSKTTQSNQYTPVSLAGITVQAKIYHPTTLAVLDTFTSNSLIDTLIVSVNLGEIRWRMTPERMAQWGGQSNVKFDVKLIKADGSIQTLLKGPISFTGL
jgi:hypothetical protein